MIHVIGDIMLDKWIYGKINRISPEAPVPILLQNSERFNLGGAGNVALNIANINGQVDLYGSIAKDFEGSKILELLKNTNVNSMISSDNLKTTLKNRLVGQNGQQICRWDNEEKYELDLPLTKLISNVSESDVVVVSDYAKGVIKENTVSSIKAKVIVDPKQDVSFYKGAYLVKPNMKEYEQWFGKFSVDEAFIQLKKYHWNWFVVTDGVNGIHVINKNKEYKRFQEKSNKIVDVTGAGDTVTAVIAHGINLKMNVFDACSLACYAASRAVERQGTTVITSKDLKKETLVWTNGVFDVLHTGHLKLLKFAKKQGDKLIVGINSDASVRKLKGKCRPINKQEERMSQLITLPWVDKVVIFNEDTPLKKIKELNPDFIIKGGDYTIEKVVGNKVAKVIIFPFVEGFSSSKIIDKIK
ncbi:PfkB family carbohydrate kinase [Alphaproteobacteria bacterium]|nr:PfkB family carbohydrate kinase [Alphaproteobacteria bacterium]